MSFGSPFFSLPDFVYHEPETLDEVLRLLKEHGDEAKVMAGGVGLLAFMKERLMSPSHVVDIKGVNELHELNFSEKEGLTVGAAVTLAAVAANSEVKETFTALHEAVAGAADPMIRGRATLVGNLCEAIPWVDSPPALIALDANAEVVGPDGKRSVPARSFIRGPVDVDLKPSELVTKIIIAAPPKNLRSTFVKFNAGSEFSIVSLAATLLHERRRRVRLVFGGVSATPVEAKKAETMVQEGDLSEKSIRRAAAEASAEVDCVSDVLASEEYRRHIVGVLVTRALRRLAER
jgi:carbon-monoxide dehydrogenase medium subunit